MAQIIKHRRGSIDSVKTTTTRNGEVLIASGSISDLAGPFVFVGSPVASDEGVAGAFKPTSKIYSGTNAPTIGVGTYGSILDGTPFYASSDESLYILNNDGVGNDRIDLTGNIEGNVISNVTVTSLTGTNAEVTNITGGTVTVTGNQTIAGTLGVTSTATVGKLISGEITGSNLKLTGDADIAGNINLGGNITVGDATTDFVSFGADISSSIIPDVNNSFDLGSSTQGWKDLFVSGTAHIQDLTLDGGLSVDSLTLPGDLTVNGNTILGDASGDTVVINSADVTMGNVPAGSTTKFIGLNSDDKLVHDTLDARIQGDTLVDNNGTPLTANRISFAADGDSLQDDADLTYNKTTNVITVGSSTVGNDISAASSLTSVGTTELKGDVGINSSLNVTGSATFKSTVDIEDETTMASAIVKDLTSGRVVLAGTGGAIEDSTKLTFDGGTLDVNGDIEATGDLGGATATITGNSTIGGTLGVTGNTEIDGTLTVNDNVTISGNLEILGTATEVNIQSTTVEIDDNIIKLNAYSPFERYAGFEVMDSGSTGVSASLVWDSQDDHWMFVSSSGQSSKVLGTTAGAYGSESSLNIGSIPVASGKNTMGDSLLTENGSVLAYNTNKFTVATDDGATLIAGNVTVSSAGGADAGTNSSEIVFRNSSNELGYISTTETTDVLDGILGYKSSDGSLIFSTVIDGGTY
tara:strand:+ start:1021 stop:3105 length:2085 start_codon:yes stop_codon:yes gene_type:complete